MIRTIKDCSCGKRCEGNTDHCSSCNRLLRKADKVTVKDAEPIQKVSEKQGKLLSKYAQLKKKFMLGRWCAYHGKPCLPTDIHHAKGRIGFADDQEIPLLVDVRYFVPLCREAHKFIEENPKFAKENGYSESRLRN
jgi:hypothetical protein